jgi:hypothetical protein
MERRAVSTPDFNAVMAAVAEGEAREDEELRAGRPAGGGSVVIDGVKYEIPDDLTYGDLLDVEQKIGPNAGPIAALAGSIWIAMRRVNPDAKFEDLRDVKFDVKQFSGGDAVPLADGPDGGAQTGDASTETAPAAPPA